MEQEQGARGSARRGAQWCRSSTGGASRRLAGPALPHQEPLPRSTASRCIPRAFSTTLEPLWKLSGRPVGRPQLVRPSRGGVGAYQTMQTGSARLTNIARLLRLLYDGFYENFKNTN